MALPTDRVRVVYLLPVGPGTDDWLDTLASIRAWADPSRRIAVLDDRGDVADALAAAGVEDPTITVLGARSGLPGDRGPLFLKVGRAMSQIAAEVRFDMLIRLDSDSLLLGPGIEDVAAQRFAAEPRLGTLGGFRFRSDGTERDFGFAARALRREAGIVGRLLGRPAREFATLREHALAEGYRDGEHVIACVQIWRAEAIRAFADSGWLECDALGRSRCADDFIFGLLISALGFTQGDLGAPGQPLALRWRGLPASPEDLLDSGVLATHSVRFYDDRDEAELRGVFAAARSAATAADSGTR